MEGKWKQKKRLNYELENDLAEIVNYFKNTSQSNLAGLNSELTRLKPKLELAQDTKLKRGIESLIRYVTKQTTSEDSIISVQENPYWLLDRMGRIYLPKESYTRLFSN